MQEWMRKHRRLIMFFILVFIGIPMVIFFGMPSGNRRQEDNADTVIAQVGGVPIMESEYRRQLDAAATRRANAEGRPSYRELDKDGTAQRVLEQMVDAAMVKIQEQQRSFDVEASLMGEKLQEMEWFRDEQGNFNPEAYNEWVQSVSRWDKIYAELQETIARQVFMGAMTAPANRVLEKKIDEELLEEQTKLRIKYAKVGLLIRPTDEEIQAHYDENPDMYREPELHQAEFVAVSITPEVPELAWELVQRARDGEDFAALANEYSDKKKPEDGAMGWRRAGDFVSPHLEPFFDLVAGEVSEPVLGPEGYYIYKVEEERINEATGQVELNGREIVLHVELDEETLDARTRLANEIAARLKETDDAGAVAAEYGLEVLRTSFFNRMKLEIENIPYDDLYQFRGKILAQVDAPWEPIVAKRNIYVGKIVDSREGDLPPLEDVRDKVIENVKNERRRTDEYQQHLAERIAAVKEQVTSVDDIVDLDSDLEVETGETEEPFSIKDSLFQQKIYVQTRDIFEALEEKAVGEVSEPVEGLLGGYWFFQLEERDEPTPERLAEMKEERQAIKDRLLQAAQFEYAADYVKDLRDKMIASVAYKQDGAAFDRILGRGIEDEEETETPDDGDTAGEDGADEAGETETSDDGDTAGEDGGDEEGDAAEETAENAASAGDQEQAADVVDAGEAVETAADVVEAPVSGVEEDAAEEMSNAAADAPETADETPVEADINGEQADAPAE